MTLTASLDPTIKYVLRDKSGSIEVRLLNGDPTPLIPYSEGMQLQALAGQNSKTWSVFFGGSILPSLLNAVGSALMVILTLLMLMTFLVVGWASLCGLGVPIGATEVEAALAFVMQFLCCAMLLRVSKLSSRNGYSYFMSK